MTLIFLSLFACEAEVAAEDPTEHACEQAAAAGETLVASAAMDDSTALLPIDSEPYTVSLVDGAASYMAVEVSEDTATLLFLGTANVVTGLYNGTEEVELPASAVVDLCAADIPEHFDVDFHTAGTWYIELGPAAITEVWLLLSTAVGHED